MLCVRIRQCAPLCDGQKVIIGNNDLKIIILTDFHYFYQRIERTDNNHWFLYLVFYQIDGNPCFTFQYPDDSAFFGAIGPPCAKEDTIHLGKADDNTEITADKAKTVVVYDIWITQQLAKPKLHRFALFHILFLL